LHPAKVLNSANRLFFGLNRKLEREKMKMQNPDLKAQCRGFYLKRRCCAERSNNRVLFLKKSNTA